MTCRAAQGPGPRGGIPAWFGQVRTARLGGASECQFRS